LARPCAAVGDTDGRFVICADVLSGCVGTTGPAAISLDLIVPFLF
jgi:homoserine acetyltransferase